MDSSNNAKFLTAKCDILQKLILESILLLEKSGLQVHNIVTDGGSWNRVMRKLFDINESNASCQHPVDSTRKLWFTSDFPHWMKTMEKNFEVQDSHGTPMTLTI